jgi:GTPase Era involved in 16S rRNA processing
MPTQGDERELCTSVAVMCRQYAEQFRSREARDTAEAVIARLEQPLRIAVSGREKAGKSTLVNALLGQKIAQTATGTCTRLVTWYSYDYREKCILQRENGEVLTFPLDNGHLPGDDVLAVRPDENPQLTVHLSNDRLQRHIVIDTPGLESLATEYSQRTSSFLAFDKGSVSAVAEADAIIYLFQQPRADDLNRLESFAHAFRGARICALNAIGVLSRVDTLTGTSEDPWPTARRIARRYEEKLGAVISNVIPVVGLLAETATSGALTESHASALRAVATTQMPRQLLLLSADRFRSSDAPISMDQKQELLETLGIYGIRQALSLVDQGVTSAAQISNKLHEHSGMAVLQEHLSGALTKRSDPLKAAAAVAAIEKLTYRNIPEDASTLRSLRQELDRIHFDPRMHQLAEMDALLLIATDRVTLADDLRAMALEVFVGDDVVEKLGLQTPVDNSELVRAARNRITRWHQAEMFSGVMGPVRTVARTAKLSNIHLLERIRNA